MAIIESGVNLEDRIKDLEVRNAVANLRNAATSSLAKYDLADQVIDDFQTAAGLHTAFSGYSTTHATGYIKGTSAPDSDTIVLISGEGNPDSSISHNTAVTAANIGNYGQASAESNLTYSAAWTIAGSPTFKTDEKKFGTKYMAIGNVFLYGRFTALLTKPGYYQELSSKSKYFFTRGILSKNTAASSTVIPSISEIFLSLYFISNVSSLYRLPLHSSHST